MHFPCKLTSILSIDCYIGRNLGISFLLDLLICCLFLPLLRVSVNHYTIKTDKGHRRKFSFIIRDSVVGIATTYGLDDREVGVRVPVRVRIFTSTCRSDLLPNGYRGGGSSPGVKRLGREADNSPLTSSEVKKMWIYTSTPPYAFMV
jgi:hypothetical protein